MKNWHIVFSSLILFLAFTSFRTHAETPPVKAFKTMKSAIKIEKDSQRKAEAWAKEKEQILEKLKQIHQQQRWLSFEEKKYRAYIAKEEQVLQELQRKKQEYDKIEMQLEPYLDEVLARLSSFVKSDLHFLPEERQKRLSFLKESLDDFRVPLSEKLRRILEALQVEANYGKGVEKTDGIIKLGGKLTQVTLFRVGRLAVFYLSPDGKKVGYLDRRTNSWLPLPGRYSRNIRKAIEMTDRRRAIELVDLPVGSWREFQHAQSFPRFGKGTALNPDKLTDLIKDSKKQGDK